MVEVIQLPAGANVPEAEDKWVAIYPDGALYRVVSHAPQPAHPPRVAAGSEKIIPTRIEVGGFDIAMARREAEQRAEQIGVLKYYVVGRTVV